jgi:hypothetical protein
MVVRSQDSGQKKVARRSWCFGRFSEEDYDCR